MTNLTTIKSKEELQLEIKKRKDIILNFYGFETEFWRTQFMNCHEEMKKLEDQFSYHYQRLNKEVAQ